jgi:serine/threonine protein kinase
VDSLPKIIAILKKSYSNQIQNSENIRDLTYSDLHNMLSGNLVDLSLDAKITIDSEPTNEQKYNILIGTLQSMGVYENYLYVNLFERLDIDLFDDTFQKFYMLKNSSLEERLEMYINLANKLKILQDMGYSHCDIKMSNILYNIIPEHGLFHFQQSKIRVIDFGRVQNKTRFCQGGTIGYLAPEVEYSLRLPFKEEDFLVMLNQCLDALSEAHLDLSFENYSSFQVSLKDVFGVVIPEEYIDLKTFFSDVSIVKPDSIADWIVLFRLLSPVFENLDLVKKINYVPQPEDVDILSNKLQVKSERKMVIKFDPSSEMDLNKLKTKFSEILSKKKPDSIQNSAAQVLGDKATQNKTIRIEIRGLKLPGANIDSPKQQYLRRFQTRRRMLEGTIDYPSLLIAPIRKSDVFSLGILFTEIETALNSNSLFKTFQEIPKENFSKDKMQQVLHEGIKRTFEIKMTRTNLQSNFIPKIKDFFKDKHDMNVSFKQYSSEFRSVHGKEMQEFLALLGDLRDLLLKMTSYYAYERPDISDVQQALGEIKGRLDAVKSKNKVYRDSINIINQRIRKTESSMLKQRYTSIYGKEGKKKFII